MIMILKCRKISMEIWKMKRKKRKRAMMNNLIQKKMMLMMLWIKLMICLIMNFGIRICKICRIKKMRIKMIKTRTKKIERLILEKGSLTSKTKLIRKRKKNLLKGIMISKIRMTKMSWMIHNQVSLKLTMKWKSKVRRMNKKKKIQRMKKWLIIFQ